MKKIVLIHQNNDFCCYCFDDKKNLCNECLKDNSHLEHFKLFLMKFPQLKAEIKMKK